MNPRSLVRNTKKCQLVELQGSLQFIRIISCNKVSKLYVLENKGVSLKYIQGHSSKHCYQVVFSSTKSLFTYQKKKTVTSVRTSGGITSEFLITVGLHQGLMLSPYLLVLVIDELSRLIQDEVPWYLVVIHNTVKH